MTAEKIKRTRRNVSLVAAFGYIVMKTANKDVFKIYQVDGSYGLITQHFVRSIHRDNFVSFLKKQGHNIITE
jgi:hypothetical protein